MGGNKKLKISASEQSRKGTPAKNGSKNTETVREPLLKLSEKHSLVLRIVAAVLVLAAAAVACWYVLSHDFNPDRHTLNGTYIAERWFVVSTSTESGSDLSNSRIFPVVFCEDGRMLYKYDTGTQIHYYQYEEGGTEPYTGTIHQYTDGAFVRDINIIREDNGDMTMHCTLDSVSFTVPRLVYYFGEDATFSMLSGIYDEEICTLLISGDYDSLTSEQLKKIGVEKNKVASLSFSLKNIPAVFELRKISDEELSRTAAMAIWDELNLADAESASDTVTSTDTE